MFGLLRSSLSCRTLSPEEILISFPILRLHEIVDARHQQFHVSAGQELSLEFHRWMVALSRIAILHLQRVLRLSYSTLPGSIGGCPTLRGFRRVG